MREDLGEDAGHLLGPLRIDERAPRRIERRPEVARQLGRHLTYGLGLSGELPDVVPVVDRPLAEALACMAHLSRGPHDVYVIGADMGGHVEPRPLARDRVDAALDADEGPLRDRRRVRAARVERTST